MATIYGIQTAAITLSGSFQNETLDANISASSESCIYALPGPNPSTLTTFFSAVYGPDSTEFFVQNVLSVESSPSLVLGIDVGILLGTIGTFINAGDIGAQDGVVILGTDTGGAGLHSVVDNIGTVSASSVGIYLIGNGSVTNSGTIVSGGEDVIMRHGGYAANFGEMVGQSGLYSAASMSSGLYSGDGIYLFNGGKINVAGPYGAGAYAAGPQAVISNVGEINTDWQGIVLNLSTATYEFGAVYNPGSINGGYFGIDASNGGYVLNSGIINSDLASPTHPYGRLGGKSGVNASPVGFGVAVGQGATAVNTGTVQGAAAIYLQYGGGSLVNAGIIHGAGDGVFMRAPGTLTNLGNIDGGTGVFSPGGFISNAGIITGSGSGYGVMLDGAGTVENSGTITGGNVGLYSTSGTIVSSGDIGGGKFAVKFAQGQSAGSTGRLIVDPGAVFDGALSGGGAALELATGGTAGNIINFGSAGAYGFGAITLDSGSEWTFTGSTTLVSVANYGTLVVAPGSSLTINHESGGGYINTAQGSIAILANVIMNSAAQMTFMSPPSSTSIFNPAIPNNVPNYDSSKTTSYVSAMSVPSLSFAENLTTPNSHLTPAMTIQA